MPLLTAERRWLSIYLNVFGEPNDFTIGLVFVVCVPATQQSMFFGVW